MNVPRIWMWVIDKATALVGGAIIVTLFPLGYDVVVVRGIAPQPAVTFDTREPNLYIIDIPNVVISGRIGSMSWRIDIMARIGRRAGRAPETLMRGVPHRGGRAYGRMGPGAAGRAAARAQRQGPGAHAGRTRAAARPRGPREGSSGRLVAAAAGCVRRNGANRLLSTAARPACFFIAGSDQRSRRGSRQTSAIHASIVRSVLGCA